MEGDSLQPLKVLWGCPMIWTSPFYFRGSRNLLALAGRPGRRTGGPPPASGGGPEWVGRTANCYFSDILGANTFP